MKIKKAVLKDYSEFKSETGNNGGDYAYFTNYEKREDGLFEIWYSSSSEFSMCPCCGSFNDHLVEEDGEEFYICGEFETITEEELIEKINHFENTDDIYFEVTEEEE